MSTLWDHYIQTQGLRIPNPLYHSPAPHCQAKKPKKYNAMLEEQFHQEQLALMTRTTNGQMLTRQLLGKIMAKDHKSHRGTS